MKPMSAKLKMRPPKMANPWGYAAGGTVDEDPTDDAETEQPTFNTQQPPMRELAAMLSKQQPAAEAPAEAPRTPASAKENVLSLREQLQKYLGKQASGSDNMQKLAEMYGKALGEGNDRTDLSPLLALSDSMYGSKLQGAYKRPLTGMEQLAEQMKAQGLVDKSNAATTSAAEKEYGQDTNAVGKEQANYYRQLATNEREIGKRSKEEQKNIIAMHDDMFLKRGTNPQVSQSLNKLQRATSGIALVDSLRDMSPDKAAILVTSGEMSNLATSIAGMVGNNNVISEHKLREITPKNVDLTAHSLLAWFMSEPQGADQTKWINRLQNEIDTETRAARRTIEKYQDAQADSYVGRVPPAVHKQQREAGRSFLQHSYYDPDNAQSYAQKEPSAGGGNPQAQGAVPVTNQRTGAKGWKYPNGKIVPRE